MNLYETALELHAAGIHVIPVRGDGTKAPVFKDWPERRATTSDLHNWFNTGSFTAMGIITGTPSGNIEMAEIEGKAAHNIQGLAALANDSGLGELWATLNQGWMEASPSGGIHWVYRVDGQPVPGNIKLASRPSTPEELAENPKQKVQTLAETRGTGGQFVAAPTPGTAHETGRPWQRLTGGPTTIPTISWDERNAFLDLLRTLDVPRPDTSAASTSAGPLTGTLGQATNHQPTLDGLSPLDDYENKTTWAQILEPAGWTHLFTRGHTDYWRRPGKNIGISATTGHADDRDRLFVFTSSTEFEPNTSITKPHAYTILNHNGDHTAAATSLHANGYGEPPKIRDYNPTQSAPQQTVIETPTSTITITGDPTNLFPDTPTPEPKQDEPHGVPVYTDHGNALLLLTEHGQNLRYNHEKGRWILWNGTRWEYQPDNHAGVRELAKTTIVNMDTTNNATAKRHQAKSLSNAGISNMLNMACTNQHIIISSDRLDAHPHDLNTPTGIVNLETGETTTHNPARLHTKQTLIGPDPTMPTPGWNAFLETTFQGNQTLIGYFQRLCGYAATGDSDQAILPFFFGSGANGKSVAVEVLMAVLGDYADAAPRGLLTTGPKSHETEIASLAGLRLAVAAEVNETDQFDEGKVKLLTGGDRIKARYLFRDFFSFNPTHTLILMGNYQPKVASGGDSFWRRLRIVPFTYRVPDEHRVEGLAKILVTEEGPGILHWIIQGAITALRDGLQDPPEVRAATHEYSLEEDALGRFLDDRCHQGDPGLLRVNTNRLLDAYSKWCRENHEEELTPQMFGRRIRNQYNIGQAKSNGIRFYTGIALQTDPDDTLWTETDN